MSRTYTRVDRDAVIAKVLEGFSDRAIAAEVGCHEKTVERIRCRAGLVESKGGSRWSHVWPEIERRYQDGEPPRTLARLGPHEETIGHYLRRRGLIRSIREANQAKHLQRPVIAYREGHPPVQYPGLREAARALGVSHNVVYHHAKGHSLESRSGWRFRYA